MRDSFTGGVIGVSCGKAILLGEHAVVHGSRALAMGLPLSVRVSAAAEKGPLNLLVPAWGCRSQVGDGTKGGEALERIARGLGIESGGARLEAKVRIPPRAGLGSSAAVAAAACRALSSLLKIEPSHGELFEAVQASEKVFHGNPSGVDAAAVLMGGVLIFSKAGGATPLETEPPRVVVAYSGEPGDTGDAVAHFARRLKDDPSEGKQRLKSIDSLVERGSSALARGDLKELGRTMNENQEHLSWFGVSTPALDTICKVARESGALGAKLTGGGRGGCAVILVRPCDTSVDRAIDRAGFEVLL